MSRADAIGVARRIAAELGEAGARAVALTGSVAAGTATARSDLDLIVISDETGFEVEAREGWLATLIRTTAEEERRRFDDPAAVGTAVPGWRVAVPLHDPDRIAAALRQESLAWSWERLGGRPDGWAAARVAEYAEEAQKLVGALEAGNEPASAVVRFVLAIRLGPIVAVRRRVLAGSENVLWHDVADALGPEWRETQEAAFATHGEPLAESCSAALRLYELAVEEVRPFLDPPRLAAAELGLAAIRGYEAGRS